MPKYSYVARDEKGKTKRGVITAADETDLANRVHTLGYFLVKSQISKDSKAKSSAKGVIKEKDLLNFTIHLGTLIESGVPLVEGLRDLAQNTENVVLAGVLDDVRSRVESGSSLKEALAMHPKSFSGLYLALIGAGEATGKLTFALQQLADYIEWQMDLKGKMKEAAIYPILLSVAMVGVVVLLITKIVPLFKPMFEQMDIELPFATQVVMGLSTIAEKYWLHSIIVMVLLGVGTKILSMNPKGKFVIDSLKLKIPIFGELIHKIIISRFCHILSLSIQSGVSVLGAMDIALQSMGNVRLEKATKKARDSVNLGEKIATSIKDTGEFPPIVVRMISVGEESGKLSQTLEKVSNFYDKEIPRTMKKIFAMFEPIMIMVMGVLVGGIAMSIFMPMFKLTDSIG